MAKAKVNVEQIKVALAEVAKSRATYEAGVAGLQRSTEETIEARLREAISFGLKDEMLDQKHEVRKSMETALAESYFLKQAGFAEAHAAHNKDAAEKLSIVAFAQHHNLKCIEAKKPQDCFAEIPKSTRYNFFTAIRAFVKNPKAGLDLWGNKARQAMNDNKKKTAEKQGPRNSQVEHQETDASKKDDKVKLSTVQVVSLQDCMAVVEKYLTGNKVGAAGLVNEKLQEALNCYKAMTGGKK